MFVVAISFFSGIRLSRAPLKRVSMNNQECKIRPEIVNFNSDEPVLYPFSIKTNIVVLVTTSMIHMQKCVFLLLLKT